MVKELSRTVWLLLFILIFPSIATGEPLKGGIEHWERGDQSQSTCERYQNDDRVTRRLGTIRSGPLTAQGQREWCRDYPEWGWETLGRAGSQCCYFAPDNTADVPPFSGPPLRPGTPRRGKPSAPDDPCLKNPLSYTCLHGHTDKGVVRPPPQTPDKLPWEQPADAQPPRGQVGTMTATVTWKERVKEVRDDRGSPVQLNIDRVGRCQMNIEFYADGQAFARNFEYHNEDRYQYFSGRREVETIQGKRSVQFHSRLQINTRGNGLYDIVWIGPALEASETKESQIYVNGRWETQSKMGGQLYQAYCIGRLFNTRNPRAGVQSKLLGVPLKGQRLTQEAGITIVRDLQKQVPNAHLDVRWDFRQFQNSR